MSEDEEFPMISIGPPPEGLHPRTRRFKAVRLVHNGHESWPVPFTVEGGVVTAELGMLRDGSYGVVYEFEEY